MRCQNKIGPTNIGQ